MAVINVIWVALNELSFVAMHFFLYHLGILAKLYIYAYAAAGCFFCINHMVAYQSFERDVVCVIADKFD